MNRSMLPLAVVVVVVAAVLGVSAATDPASAPAPASGRAERVAVRHTDAVCPAPAGTGDTPGISAFAPGPVGGTDAGKGSTALRSANGDLRTAGPKAPGESVRHTLKKDTGTVTATAEDSLAPGFTVQQTERVDTGTGRGLSGLDCPRPAASFWFAGASLSGQRSDTVTVVNPGSESATVDVDLYGKDGPVEADNGKGVVIKPGGSEQIPLNSLTGSKPHDVAVHVVSHSGRVAAALQSTDSENGSDWLPDAASGRRPVVPGIPHDAKSVRLIVANPGSDDTTLAVRLSGKSGVLNPAKHSTVDVPAGGATAVDLGDVSHGEASAVLLSPAPGSPAADVVAGVRVTRGSSGDGEQDASYLASTRAVGDRADAAGNLAGRSTLMLTAPGKKEARATVTAGGGEGKDVTVPAGATVSVDVPKPPGDQGKGKGKGGDPYGVSVETRGGGPVYAARMIAEKTDGVAMFTIQPMGDDRSQVTRPAAREDDTVLFGD